MNTTIQTRIDSKLKKEAKNTLAGMGLDLSTSIKLFLTQVVHTKSIPFPIQSADNLPESIKQEFLRESQTALISGKRYKNIRSAHKDILKKKGD